jgi:serine phosphatase RsbU (regulator of sigma subunit)
MEPDEPYTSERFEMPDAACMVLYTDGVVDAENAAGEPLDVEGLRRCLTACDREAKAIVEEVAAAVRRFRGDAELADDVTVVAVQLRPRRAEEDIAPDLPEDVADEARASIGAGEG